MQFSLFEEKSDFRQCKKNLNATKPPEQSKGLGRNIGCKDKNSTRIMSNMHYIGKITHISRAREKFRAIFPLLVAPVQVQY